MKTLTLILTLILLAVMNSVDGHRMMMDPGSFLDEHIYIKPSRGGATYKIVADLHFNSKSRFTVTRTVSGSICNIYVNLITDLAKGVQDVPDYVLVNYNQTGAKATFYQLYMVGSGITVNGGSLNFKGAEEE